MVAAPKYTIPGTSSVTVEQLLDELEKCVLEVEQDGLPSGCDVSSAQAGATALTVGMLRCFFGIEAEQGFQLAYARSELAIRKAYAAKQEPA